MPLRPKATSAVEKALSVLEYVVREARSPSAAEIGEALGVPRQTAHRTLQELERLGLLRRGVDRDRYLAGDRLTALSISAISNSVNGGGTRSILADLVAQVQETCNLGVLDGGEVVYVDRIECDWPLRVQLKVGSRVPAHCTAIGKLLLAHLDPSARRRALGDGALRRFTPNTIVDRAKLDANLDQIAAQGYAINDQEDSVGLIALATPVRGRRGAVVAGLAVHAPSPRYPIGAAIGDLPLFREAADRISGVLFGQNEKT
jgi:DNA-binding IclR family transcriptional regulator